MLPIYLSGGEIAIVDDVDYTRVAHFNWRVMRSRNGLVLYAMKDSEPRMMHRLILNANDGELIDHKNGCGLDNRRSNIIIATGQQNATNQRRHRDGKSFGVDLLGKKWRARLAGQYIGLFETQFEAELAYDRAALEKYGDKARLNHPDEREVT